MSRVFVAYDQALERRVVVKVLSPELMADVNAERFRREILVVAGLQHPHIVPVLSAGEMAGRPYLVMPFVEGESLRARIARGARSSGAVFPGSRFPSPVSRFPSPVSRFPSPVVARRTDTRYPWRFVHRRA